MMERQGASRNTAIFRRVSRATAFWDSQPIVVNNRESLIGAIAFVVGSLYASHSALCESVIDLIRVAAKLTGGGKPYPPARRETWQSLLAWELASPHPTWSAAHFGLLPSRLYEPVMLSATLRRMAFES